LPISSNRQWGSFNQLNLCTNHIVSQICHTSTSRINSNKLWGRLKGNLSYKVLKRDAISKCGKLCEALHSRRASVSDLRRENAYYELGFLLIFFFTFIFFFIFIFILLLLLLTVNGFIPGGSVLQCKTGNTVQYSRVQYSTVQ
jgi:hypothetical protein